MARGTTKSAPAATVSVWAVLNVTPDSFSDGGMLVDSASAIRRAEELVCCGADVIDVGGESTRPRGRTYGDPVPVTEAEEMRRILPVVEALGARARVSVDTTKAKVASEALRRGALIINDVSCGRDEALLRVVGDAGAELVLMHNRGGGERAGANVVYGEVARDVRCELLEAVERAVRNGVAREQIWLDPGVGFAKTPFQSLVLLGRIPELVATGHRILVGPSRKSFIGDVMKESGAVVPSPQERLGGTAAAVAMAVAGGVHAIRVHDVFEMRQAAFVALAIREAGR